MEICVAGSGLCAMQLTQCCGKEGEDKNCGVFTRLRAVRRLRSDMWWQHSATLLIQPASPGYWGQDCPRLDYLQACVPSKIFCEDTLRNLPLQGLLIGWEPSFINGTDYMQVKFFSCLMIINGCWIKRLIWPVWYSTSAWERTTFPSPNCREWKRESAVHTLRES